MKNAMFAIAIIYAMTSLFSLNIISQSKFAKALYEKQGAKNNKTQLHELVDKMEWLLFSSVNVMSLTLFVGFSMVVDVFVGLLASYSVFKFGRAVEILCKFVIQEGKIDENQRDNKERKEHE